MGWQDVVVSFFIPSASHKSSMRWVSKLVPQSEKLLELQTLAQFPLFWSDTWYTRGHFVKMSWKTITCCYINTKYLEWSLDWNWVERRFLNSSRACYYGTLGACLTESTSIRVHSHPPPMRGKCIVRMLTWEMSTLLASMCFCSIWFLRWPGITTHSLLWCFESM